MSVLFRPHSRKRGVSLIELMVSMALTAVIVSAAFQIFQEGMQLYKTNQAAADAQSNVTKVLGMMSLDLSNAAGGLTRFYPNPKEPSTSGEPPGLTFATPLGEAGYVRYDPGNGTIYWQRYVSYYFEPDSDPKGHNGKIWRAWEEVDPDVTGGPGDRNIANIVKFLGVHFTSYFAASSKSQRKLVSDGISGFVVKPYDGDKFNDVDKTKLKLAYDVTIEAGDKVKALRNSYYIGVTSRIVPRAAGG